MQNQNKQPSTFPIGFHKFHSKKLFNFNLNRWYSLGLIGYDELREAGSKIAKYDDWKEVMLHRAKLAEKENRKLDAAFLYRSADFFTMPDDPDKSGLYDKFQQHFYDHIENDNFQMAEIPYKNGYLPAINIPSATNQNKGTIVLHGGFDSYIEEWYFAMKYLSESGYDVIGFEGPGQGGALIRFGLAFDHRWEQPTSKILDYFDIDQAIIYGLSMGGWFCLRAAAFEPRIKKVIASGHAIDYMKLAPAPMRKLFLFFMKYENFFDKGAYRKMRRSDMIRWQISNAMYITKSDTPLEATRKTTLVLSEKNQYAEKVKQDVLLQVSAADHFIPFRLHKMQKEALINAKSIEERIYKVNDDAENHCQIGNFGLALDDIINWLERKQ